MKQAIIKQVDFQSICIFFKIQIIFWKIIVISPNIQNHISPPYPTLTSIFNCMHAVLVSVGCHNKIPWTGELKQQKFVFLQFWRLEVWDHDVSMVLERACVCRIFSCCGGEGESELCHVFSYKGNNPISGLHPHDLI